MAAAGTAQAAQSGEASPTVIVMRDVTEVRAARAARDAFMGVLSHELRTPITTIYGGSEILSRDLDEEHRAEVIADIRAESERLARLVEDLLVMTRVERGIVEIADEPILFSISSQRDRGRRGALAGRAGDAARRGPPVGGPRRRDVHRTGRAQPADQRRALRRAALRNGIDVVAEEAPDEVIVRVLDHGRRLRRRGTGPTASSCSIARRALAWCPVAQALACSYAAT